jgi:hypothetical protein
MLTCKYLDIIVVFPFSLTIPKTIVRPIRAFLVFARVLPQPIVKTKVPKIAFPFNFVTAPLVSVLFLLAIEAIGREEVRNGIIGDNGYVRTQSCSICSFFSCRIIPIDIMAFFLTLVSSILVLVSVHTDRLQGLLGNIHRHCRSRSSVGVLGLAQGRKVRTSPLLLSLYLLFLPGDFHWQCSVHSPC